MSLIFIRRKGIPVHGQPISNPTVHENNDHVLPPLWPPWPRCNVRDD